MAQQINVGDLVVLKSGGPVMTVEFIREDTSKPDAVWCVWFDETEQKKGGFALGALKGA